VSGASPSVLLLLSWALLEAELGHLVSSEPLKVSIFRTKYMLLLPKLEASPFVSTEAVCPVKCVKAAGHTCPVGAELLLRAVA
jgi:hypothetical protein